MKVLVLGATGATGRLLVSQALAAGHAVFALFRSKSRAADLAGADLVEGNARDAGVLARAIAGCDAVVCSSGTGLSSFKDVTMLSAMTRALVIAMVEHGLKRLVCITGVGAGDSRGHGSFFYDRVFQPLLLRKVYEDTDRQEESNPGERTRLGDRAADHAERQAGAWYSAGNDRFVRHAWRVDFARRCRRVCLADSWSRMRGCGRLL